MADIIFGLDIGTTKVCAVVGEVRDEQLQIIGLGVTPSRGMRKGMVVDVQEASVAVAKAVELAEQTSGYDLREALVSMAGEHISCLNTRGVTAIGRDSKGINMTDVEYALAAAQNIPIPHNREIVHVIPREYQVDDQKGVRNPIGMHAYKLEVEAHIVTGSSPALLNLGQCAANVDVSAEAFVLNVLASAEAVLSTNEREMDVIVADIGGGTTDIAIYRQGSVWHTKVLAVGGYHVTNDIAIGLRAPYEVAEKVKIQHGDCRPQEIDAETVFTVEPFGGEKIQVGQQDLAYVIEARVEEIFQLILKEIKNSGYDGLLTAGIVLTGGAAQLNGITTVAERVLNMPARVGSPVNLLGLVDRLNSPAYATSVGLLRWMISGYNAYRPRTSRPSRRFGRVGFSNILRALLPE
ncbi:MAG: cell division protein FtsA [Anaerolineales bacterium]|nr:cell division protein FtsA [Anaerolineales bacterium]